MHIVCIGMPVLIYVKLYLGFYDLDRRHIRRHNRKDGGCHERCAGLCGGCGFSVYYDDRCDGALGGTYGDRAEIRSDCETDAGDTAVYQLPVSTDPEGASREGVYLYESDRQCAGAWLGMHAGRALSYYSDRLKNPLRNQGFPPNLVLMKNVVLHQSISDFSFGRRRFKRK